MATELSAPRDSTIRRLFALSMNRCAFPECSTPILDLKTKTILAEVCHIHAQNENGPRYKRDQTAEERHGLENLILMCGVHHKIIDAPASLGTYTAKHLLAIKSEHESQAAQNKEHPDTLTRAQLNKLKAGSIYAGTNVAHMDF